MYITKLLRAFINKSFYTSNIELLRTTILENNADKVNSLLIETDVNVNINDMIRGATPLIHAVNVENIDVNIIKALIAHGANTNIQGSYEKNTALHWAARDGNPEIVNILLGEGAKPNIQNIKGDTPLKKASISNHTEVVDILLANGANPNIRGDMQRIPLHWAAIMCHGDTAEILLNHGSDITLLDTDKQSAKGCSEKVYRRLAISNKPDDQKKAENFIKVIDAEYTAYMQPLKLMARARDVILSPLESR